MARLALVFAALLLASPASADWLHGVNKDAFNGDSYWALSGDFISVAGFTCTKEDPTPELVYVAPDKVDDDLTVFLKTADLKLAVIVDDEPKVELPATLGFNTIGNNYRIAAKSPDTLPLLFKARDAKRRFAVGLEINGDVAEQQTFDVIGSTAALRSLEKGCDLGELEAAKTPAGAKAVADHDAK
jgi:hypothetical protein